LQERPFANQDFVTDLQALLDDGALSNLLPGAYTSRSAAE
jgi:hypothetical protein